MKENIFCKTTFDENNPSKEVGLRWKISLDWTTARKAIIEV